ncbi:hypothetical protein [Paraliobacillus sp. X-1268]|uniref:hypothetical protein n=1 Tax=Paraliobacillus sp. X-1268 TaxID=2213193 RepID=UPI000E3C3D88|nr:hypothetical protein [Paraliobacillus sp. X-1268]
MIKKIITSAFTLFLIAGFAGGVGVDAAASISPSNQTIYGTDAYANWTFAWTSSSYAKQVSFNPGDGTGYRTANSRTNSSSMTHKYEYSSSSVSKLYYPKIAVYDLTSGATVGTGSATVHKRLSN